jgi:hypothetical protein
MNKSRKLEYIVRLSPLKYLKLSPYAPEIYKASVVILANSGSKTFLQAPCVRFQDAF